MTGIKTKNTSSQNGVATPLFIGSRLGIRLKKTAEKPNKPKFLS